MGGVGIALDDLKGAHCVPHEGNKSYAADPMAERVARLSQGQLDCLLLVDQHLNSKEIAAEFNISPHTVDQRIRQLEIFWPQLPRALSEPLSQDGQIMVVAQELG